MVFTPRGQGLQSRVGRYPDDGFAGLIRQITNSVDAIYPIGSSSQVYTVNFGTVATNTDYTLTVNNYSLVIPSGGTAATQAEILAVIQGDSYVGSLFTASTGAGTIIILTHRQPGATETVTIAGGAAAATVANPTAQSILPLGRWVDLASAANLSDLGLPGIKLSVAASGQPFGIAGISTHAYPRYMDPATGEEVAGFVPGKPLTVLRSGSIWLGFESAVGAGAAVYRRATANGALTKIGYSAPAAGTGLVLVAGAQTTQASVLTSDGEHIAPVELSIL